MGIASGTIPSSHQQSSRNSQPYPMSNTSSPPKAKGGKGKDNKKQKTKNQNNSNKKNNNNNSANYPPIQLIIRDGKGWRLYKQHDKTGKLQIVSATKPCT